MLRRRSRRGAAAFLAAAAVMVGHSLQFETGTYGWSGLRWLSIGIVLAWVGVLFRTNRSRGGGLTDWAIWCVCGCGLVWQLRELAISAPLGDVPVSRTYYYFALPALAATASGAILLPRWWRRTVFIPALLLVYIATGIWLLRASPNPPIDVFQVTRDACRAISRGENPYAIDFPDIYTAHPEWEAAFYPPGFVYDGRVHFGYQYMPLSFGVAYGGYLIDGDFRLGNLLAVAAAAAFLAYAQRGRLGIAAASLLLTTPRGFFVLERGWSEPAVVFCLALVVFCACRKRAWLPWAIGLLMVSKQHIFLAAPAVLLLLPRPWQWRTAFPFIWKAVLIGAVVTLPLVLWNVHAFWHSAVEVQIKNPFRADSMNYAAALVQAGGREMPGWIAFAAALLAAVVCVWQAGMGPAAFCAAVAVIYLCFFALAKQAFYNYYFFTIGALCCAVAATRGNRWASGARRQI
jgi:hypothetical protein